MSIGLAFGISIALLLILLIKTKISPFISMMIASLTMGLLAGLGGEETVKVIINGFSSTTASVGIIIIFGTVLGKYLEETRAVNKLAYSTLQAVGEKNANLALTISGFLVSIPVFVDVAFIMLAPLYKSIAKRTKFPVAPLAVALALGLLNSNALVPPTPGPLAVAGILGLDIGRAMFYGLIVAFIASLFGWAYCQFYLMKKDESWYTYADESILQDVHSQEQDNEEDMPGFLVSIMPILIPIILILLNTSFKAIYPAESKVLSITSFIGNSNVALGIGIISAILLLKNRMSNEVVLKVIDDSLKSCGPIIFITAAGGSLAKVIDATGAGASIAEVLIASGLPLILVPFLISGISKFVQGSGSVAMIMAATLCAPLVTGAGVDPVLIFLSACAGSSLGSQVNNSFFWVFVNLNGYDVKTGFKTLCIGQQIIGLGGLVGVFLVSLFI